MPSLPTFIVTFLETGFHVAQHVAQAGLEFTVDPKMTLDS